MAIVRLLKKEGDFFEKGEISKRGKRKDLDVLAELVIDGNNNRSIDKLNPVGYMKFNEHINALRSALIGPKNTKPMDSSSVLRANRNW